MITAGSTWMSYRTFLEFSPLSFTAVKQVFMNMELLGWYTIGDLPTVEDTKFHEQVNTLSSLVSLLDLYSSQ